MSHRISTIVCLYALCLIISLHVFISLYFIVVGWAHGRTVLHLMFLPRIDILKNLDLRIIWQKHAMTRYLPWSLYTNDIDGFALVQVISWTNGDLLPIGHSGKEFNKISIKMLKFSLYYKNCIENNVCKIATILYRPKCFDMYIICMYRITCMYPMPYI